MPHGIVYHCTCSCLALICNAGFASHILCRIFVSFNFEFVSVHKLTNVTMTSNFMKEREKSVKIKQKTATLIHELMR